MVGPQFFSGFWWLELFFFYEPLVGVQFLWLLDRVLVELAGHLNGGRHFMYL
jgi:hypothetical protein